MNRHNIIFALVLLLTLNSINLVSQEIPRSPIPIDNAQVNSLREAAFVEALRKDDTDSVRTSLKAGQDANVEAPSGHNALSIAAIENRPHLIQLLLDFGADVDQVSHSASALVYATSLNHARCVEELLNSGADPNVTSTDGKTAMHYAAMLGHTKLVEKLFDFGVSLNARDTEGSTPLTLATENQHLDVVKLLLNYGADRALRNKSGKNAKEIAVNLPTTEMTLVLSQENASPTDDDMKKRKTIRDAEAFAKALADASPGDILQLGSRTYDGEFVVTESQVTIVGDPSGGTVLRNSKGNQEFVFYIREGANVSLQKLRFEFDGPNQVGLYSDGSKVELSDCRFDGATHHACFGVDSQLRLFNCRFENFAQIGLFATGKSSIAAKQCVFKNGQRTAVQLESGAHGELWECRFDDVASASILAIEASQLSITGCQFDKTKQAVSVEKLAGKLSVLDCRFETCKTAVRATNVQGGTRVIQCDFHQSKDSLASYIENGNSTLLARNRVFGGQVAFNIQGRFDVPVAVAKNRIFDTIKGAVFVRAKSPQAESPVIRLSRNSIIAETGYGVLLEAASPAVFVQNRILISENMAVSLQRGSAAVFNNNCIFSNELAVNLFESDASQTTMVREQIYGPTPVALEERLTTEISQRLKYVTDRVDSVKAMRSHVIELLKIVRNGTTDSFGFEQPWAKLENQIRVDRELSNSLIPVTLTIEDKAGNRRRSGFNLYQSESAASGLSLFVNSDLRDTAALKARLGEANSPFEQLSNWVNGQPNGEHGADDDLDLLTELNRQLEDPSLYVASRFEGIVDSQFVEQVKRLGRLEKQNIETIRWVNRRLLEQAFPQLIKASAPIGVSTDRPLFVSPGRYWIVSRDNQNLIQFVQIRSDNGEVVVSLPQSIWMAIQPRDKQPLRWELFQLRKPKQVKYELEHIRRRISPLKSVLKSDATKEQIGNARKTALASLEVAILPLIEAKKIDPTLDDSRQFEISRYVRQVLALTGNAADAKLIVKKLNNVKDVINILMWLETVAHIESRVGNLESGELIRLAKANDDTETAASAAIQLHLMGVNQADAAIRRYLQNPVDRVLAQRAAWTLLDDDHDETRLAMLSFHNQLMLDMEKDRWERWKTMPTTLYLLGYGTPSDLRYISVTPMTAIHLKWMAPLLADPLQAAQVLIDIHNFDGARDLATSFLNRNGGEVYYNQLVAAIIAGMQSENQNRIQQLRMAYHGKMGSEVYCSFFRPNRTAAKLLGGFDDTNTFIDLRARADFSVDMQSVVTWNADPKQLDLYVQNWQAGHNNYIEKLDYFSLEEIEESLDRVGGAKPPGYELFKVRHLIASSRGISRRDYFPYGIERRAYILGQSKTDEKYPGAINGVLEVKVDRHQTGTRIWVRHRQDAYFDQLGTLASTIGSHSKPEHWPIFRYLENDGRSLIQSIQLRKGDQRIELVETGETKDGFRAFDVDVSDPTKGEHYLDLSLNFFGREETLSFALHSGEIGREFRRNR